MFQSLVPVLARFIDLLRLCSWVVKHAIMTLHNDLTAGLRQCREAGYIFMEYFSAGGSAYGNLARMGARACPLCV